MPSTKYYVRATRCAYSSHIDYRRLREERIVVLEGALFMRSGYLRTLLTHFQTDISRRLGHIASSCVHLFPFFFFEECKLSHAVPLTRDTGPARKFALPRSHGCAAQRCRR
jgi:hypothetical protein